MDLNARLEEGKGETLERPSPLKRRHLNTGRAESKYLEKKDKGMSQPPIGPYFLSPAACHDYDPDAPRVAQRVALLMTDQLPTLVVEHIGSSSVPGCAGKGIVDLMVLYPQGQLEATKHVLETLGFQRQTTPDPWPEERPMRTGTFEYDGSIFRLHAHVIAADSAEVEELRTFRERLRADPELVAAYVARKRAIIASGITDEGEYATAKGSFVQDALSGEAR
jgi:GrpB-like predicted nucleotidyltransferase (UPF0157 family)